MEHHLQQLYNKTQQYLIIIQHNSTVQANTTKIAVSSGDPIITGTVKINKYINGTLYNLQGATITINSTGTNSRILGTTTTDQNGNYYINFIITLMLPSF